jgi:hypothetical protein
VENKKDQLQIPMISPMTELTTESVFLHIRTKTQVTEPIARL